MSTLPPSSMSSRLASGMPSPERGSFVSDFQAECEAVLVEVRAAFWAIAEHPRLGATKARDLELALKVDAALAWGVYKAGSARSPLEAALYIPGPGSMDKFFKAAAKAGVPEPVVERARLANTAFSALVERHADDRDIFNAMVADLAGFPDETAAHVKKQKRNAFRALRYVYGLQVQTMFNTAMLHPSEGGGAIDVVNLSGDIGLRRFRGSEDVRRRISFRNTFRGPDATLEPLRLAGHVLAGGEDAPFALLNEFCPAEGIDFTIAKDDEFGTQAIGITPRTMGKTGTASYIFGWLERRHVRYADIVKDDANYSFHSSVPAETFIQDVLVHPEVWDRPHPTLKLYSRRRSVEKGLIYEECDRLPLQEQVELLGTGLACAHTPDIPRYAELLEATAAHMGWNPREFRIYRARLEGGRRPARCR